MTKLKIIHGVINEDPTSYLFRFFVTQSAFTWEGIVHFSILSQNGPRWKSLHKNSKMS